MIRDFIMNLLFSDKVDTVVCDVNNSKAAAIIDFFRRQKLLMVYCNKFSNNNDINLFRKENELDIRIKRAQFSEVMKICTFLSGLSIEYALTKGPALSNIIYNDLFYRKYNDIDIVLCNFDMDIGVVLRYLKENGYYQNLGWGIKQEIDYENILMPERVDHHEIKCIKGINDLYKTEIKNALSCVPKFLMLQFNNHRTIYNIESNSIVSYDIIHTFLILCSNTFINSESRSAIYYNARFVRDYYDLYCFVKKYRSKFDIDAFMGYAHKYKLQSRIKRVFENLLSLLKFNDNIAHYNENEILWLNNIIAGIVELQNTDIKDAFLESIPGAFEVINWHTPFVNRIFEDARTECIVDYKKHVYDYDLPCINTEIKQDLGINMTVTFNNSYIICCIGKERLLGGSYKVEILSNEKEVDTLFYGFIVENDVISNSVSNIFSSNAKHYEKYTDMNISIVLNGDNLECDLTPLTEKIVFDNKKVIFRVSTVKRIECDMYQEIDSASYQYCLE